jgi:cytochrome c553
MREITFVVLGVLAVGIKPIFADSVDEQLFKSILSKDVQAVQNLIADGANVNADNGKGHTALSFAFFLKNTEVITALVEAGADIDAEFLAEKGGCGSCHNSASGSGVAISNSAAPNLAAQNKEYLVKQMNDFHSGKRTISAMETPSQTLIAPVSNKLAEYYSKLPRYENSSDVTAEVLNAGRTIYQANCQECHGEDGINTVNNVTPTLAGMNSNYIAFQLVYFQTGYRENDEGALMRTSVEGLSKEDIEVVSAYVQSLK